MAKVPATAIPRLSEEQKRVLRDTQIDEAQPGPILHDFQVLLDFVGDGLPYAVIEYKPEEARIRVLLTDWLDWTPLDSQTQQDISAFIAAKDLELGEQLQGAVLVQGWIELALSGSAAQSKVQSYPGVVSLPGQLHLNLASVVADDLGYQR